MTMLSKLIYRPSPATLMNPTEEARSSSGRQLPLRIIHAGGTVECYYMAIPAASIINKHPQSVLARPDIFRKPWESIVRPDEIMKPGEKFYVVPRGTVRKLQKRLRQPPTRVLLVEESESESSVSRKYTEPKMIMERSSGKNMFIKENNSQQSVAQVKIQRKKKVRFVGMWQPSLMSIEESSQVAEL